jgi:hypothetical protein
MLNSLKQHTISTGTPFAHLLGVVSIVKNYRNTHDNIRETIFAKG